VAGDDKYEVVATLTGHTCGVNMLCCDEDLLVSFDTDKIMRVWRMENYQCLHVLPAEYNFATASIFSGRVAIVDLNHMWLWDAYMGKQLWKVEKSKETKDFFTTCVLLVKDCLVTVCDSTGLQVWSAATVQLLHTLDHKKERHIGVTSLFPSPSKDGCFIAGHEGPDIKITMWNAKSGQLLRVMRWDSDGGRGHGPLNDGYRVHRLHWNDGIITSSTSGGIVAVWDSETGAHLRTLVSEIPLVVSNYGLFYQGGRVVVIPYFRKTNLPVVGKDGGYAEVWRITESSGIQELEDKHWVCTAGMGEGVIVSSREDNSVRVLDVTTGKQLRVLESHTSDVHSVRTSGGYIVASSYSKVLVWDSGSGELLRTHEVEGEDDFIKCTNFDGKRIVAGTQENKILVWQASDGELIKTFTREDRGGFNKVWCCCKDRILSDAFGVVELWDIASGQLLTTVWDGEEDIGYICPFEDVIVTANHNYAVQVWDLQTGQNLRHIEQQDSDGRKAFPMLIVAGGWIVAAFLNVSTLIKVWSFEDGKLLRTLFLSTSVPYFTMCSSSKSLLIQDSDGVCYLLRDVFLYPSPTDFLDNVRTSWLKGKGGGVQAMFCWGQYHKVLRQTAMVGPDKKPVSVLLETMRVFHATFLDGADWGPFIEMLREHPEVGEQ